MDMTLPHHQWKDIVVVTEGRMKLKTSSVVLASLLWLYIWRADKLGKGSPTPGAMVTCTTGCVGNKDQRTVADRD